MNLNGVEYWYIRNAQGDITGLFDENGTDVVKYTYDSWGEIVSTTGSLASTVGAKNPYRYRGYRYDTETGLYYLQSRYYSPEWGRFINVDGLIGTDGELLSHNMFAYCKNNAINMSDPNGYFPLALPFVIGIVEALVKAVVVASSIIAAAYAGDAIGTIIKEKSETKPIGIPIEHGNSKKNKKHQHGYEIYNKKTGDVVKVGISGGKVRLDGKSYRAEKQVRVFNRLEKGEIYASRIMAKFSDRQSALNWEWLNSQFRYYQGHSMKYHKRPGFDNWWDMK